MGVTNMVQAVFLVCLPTLLCVGEEGGAYLHLVHGKEVHCTVHMHNKINQVEEMSPLHCHHQSIPTRSTMMSFRAKQLCSPLPHAVLTCVSLKVEWPH